MAKQKIRRVWVDDQSQEHSTELGAWKADAKHYKSKCKEGAEETLRLAAGLISTWPEFSDQHPENVLKKLMPVLETKS